MSAHGPATTTTKKHDHNANAWAIGAQWVVYFISGYLLGNHGVDLYNSIITTGQRSAHDSVMMIVWAAAVGAFWAIMTYAIRRRIHITDPASLPDPAEPGLKDPAKHRRAAARAAAVRRNKEAEGERESVMSQFSWAGMLLGVPLGMGAVGLAILPVAVLIAHPVAMLIALPVFAGIFMLCVKLEKPKTWGLIPAGALILTLIWGLAATRWQEVLPHTSIEALIADPNTPPRELVDASELVRIAADELTGSPTRWGMYDQALRGHREAIKRFAGSGDNHEAFAHSGVGLILRKQGKLGDAIPELEKATEQWPSNPDLWKNLGVARTEADDIKGAIVALEMSNYWRPNRAIAAEIERLRPLAGS